MRNTNKFVALLLALFLPFITLASGGEAFLVLMLDVIGLVISILFILLIQLKFKQKLKLVLSYLLSFLLTNFIIGGMQITENNLYLLSVSVALFPLIILFSVFFVLRKKSIKNR